MVNFRELRLQRGLELKEVSAKLGLTSTLLAQYEENEKEIPPGGIEILNYYYFKSYYPGGNDNGKRTYQH